MQNFKEIDVSNVQLNISIILEYANQLIANADNGIPKVDVLNAIKVTQNKMEFVLYQILTLLMLFIVQILYAKNGPKIFVRIVQIELIATIKMFALKLITIAILMIDLMDFA